MVVSISFLVSRFGVTLPVTNGCVCVETHAQKRHIAARLVGTSHALASFHSFYSNLRAASPK